MPGSRCAANRLDGGLGGSQHARVPELPDVHVYLECLRPRVLDQQLLELDLLSPFLLRTVEPPATALVGTRVQELRRIGKRIVFGFEEDRFLVCHLMIAGRLRWRQPDGKPPGRIAQAALRFASGTLWLTEASSKKRASLHVVSGEQALADFDRGGLRVLESNLEEFTAAAGRENRTLKRFLTDPRLLDGIGNAYSDEILFRAGLSPLLLTSRLTGEQVRRLHEATIETLRDWMGRLRDEVGDGFPEKVTAFRPGMAVHGRYRQPCLQCGRQIQRIRYARNECNYCAACQNEGRLLADRGLSQLMRRDWPRTLEELDELRGGPTS